MVDVVVVRILLILGMVVVGLLVIYLALTVNIEHLVSEALHIRTCTKSKADTTSSDLGFGELFCQGIFTVLIPRYDFEILVEFT